MQSILSHLSHTSNFLTGWDEDQVMEILQQCQETMKGKFDRKHIVQVRKPLSSGTSVMVQKSRSDLWTYIIIVDVPEPTVHEGCCYKIKLSSGRIITRNSIQVHSTCVPPKTFLTNTDKKAELKPISIAMYSPVSAYSLNNPSPSADHKAGNSGPDKCQSKPSSKAKKVLTSASKKTVKCLGRVRKPAKRSGL